MDKYPDNLLSQGPVTGMFFTTLLSRYEANNSERFYVKYEDLKRWFDTHERFVKTLFLLEEQGFFKLKGARSLIGPYFDMPSVRERLLSGDKEGWLVGSDFDMKIDHKKISSIMYRDRSSDQKKDNGNQEYKIEKITVFKGEGRSGNIIINDDFAWNVLDVDFGKPSWELLLRLSEKEEVGYDTKTNKAHYDYLNTGKDCKIYTHLKCEPQKLLKIVNGVIKPCVQIERISEKAFKTRLNKTTA